MENKCKPNDLFGSAAAVTGGSVPVVCLERMEEDGATVGGAPVFLKQPSDSYVIKNTPATLHCRVANAVDIHFQCNAEILAPTRLDHHVEPETGLKYTEASVQISRDKVEEYFGEFHCTCLATSAQSEAVQSRPALVTFACEY